MLLNMDKKGLTTNLKYKEQEYDKKIINVKSFEC